MRANSHHHSYGEILVCLSGDHAYGIGTHAAQLHTGSALLIRSAIPHDAAYSVHHAACTDFWMHFLPDGLVAMKLVDHDPRRRIRLIPIACPTGALALDFRRAGTLIEQHRNGDGISGRKTLGFLTYVLQAVFEVLAEGGVRKVPDHESSIIEAIKHYACRHLQDRLTLTELARVAGYSPFHFHRMFLRIEGITPKKFVLQKRLECACSLLDAGHSVTSAALDAGFSDSSQFARAFKLHFKRSPKHWRMSGAR